MMRDASSCSLFVYFNFNSNNFRNLADVKKLQTSTSSLNLNTFKFRDDMRIEIIIFNMIKHQKRWKDKGISNNTKHLVRILAFSIFLRCQNLVSSRFWRKMRECVRNVGMEPHATYFMGPMNNKCLNSWWAFDWHKFFFRLVHKRILRYCGHSSVRPCWRKAKSKKLTNELSWCHMEANEKPIH